MAKSKSLPGRFKIGERDNAPNVGYWLWDSHDKTDPTFAKLRAAYDTALESGTQFQEKSATLRKNDRLSEKGIAEALSRYVTDDGMPHLAQNKLKAVGAIRRDVAARLNKMVPVEIDKTDVVAEMQRREIRDALRTMPNEDRIKTIESNKHPEIINAVLSAPSFLSGVPDSVRKMAEDRILGEKYGDERKLLGETLEAAELVERAYDAARDELRHAAGLTPFEFDKLAQPIEQSAAEEYKKVLNRTPALESPVQDAEALAEAINALPYKERSEMIDRALAKQSEDLSARESRQSTFGGTPIRMPGE